jgi:hypothetical protein
MIQQSEKHAKSGKYLKSSPVFSKIKLMIKPPNAPKVPGAIGAYPRPKKVAMILLNFRTITFLRRDLQSVFNLCLNPR